MPQRMIALRKALRWRALKPRTFKWEETDSDTVFYAAFCLYDVVKTMWSFRNCRSWHDGLTTFIMTPKVSLFIEASAEHAAVHLHSWMQRDVLWRTYKLLFIPQYCPQLVPVKVAEVCLSRSWAVDETVCVHLQNIKPQLGALSSQCVELYCQTKLSSVKFFSVGFSLPTFRSLLEIFVLILRPHRVLRLIVWKIILPLWATHQRETVHCVRFCWWPLEGAMALQLTTDHYSWACSHYSTSGLQKWGESWILSQTITLNLECTPSCDGL